MNAVLAAIGLVLGASAAQPWFGVTFDGYADGETLSDRGATGGSWGESPTADAKAVKVTDGELAVAEVQGRTTTNGVTFAASEAAGDISWTVNLRMKFDHPLDLIDYEPDGPISLTLTDDETGAFHFAGWAGGVWRLLDAADLPAATNVWYDIRIESRNVGGEEYVGFVLVTGDAARHELKAANGGHLFAVGRKASADVRTVTFVGKGRFGAFDGVRATSDPTPVLHWVGGAAGDWNAATNWSETAGGAPAGRCPSAGEAIRVDGSAVLVRGEESATLRDFLAGVREDGTLDLWSGTFLTPVTLDTSRVRAGKKLEAVAEPFGGLSNPVSATWFHAAMAAGGKKGGFEQVATGASYAPQKADYESWFRCSYGVEGGPVETKEFFFSKLPVLYLTTDDGQTPTAEKEKHDGWVTVQGNDDFKPQYDGKMTINVRGNTTAQQGKKPWKLKLDEKTKMFDIDGKSKHWVLLANAMDATGWRNKICYDFANEVGTTGMDSTFVTCFLNGSYQGLYQFCEQVRIGAGRVDIHDWESAGEDVAKALAKGAKLSDEAKDALKDEMAENFQWVTSGQVAYDGVTYDLGDYVKDFASYTNDLSGGYLYEFDSKNGDALTKLNVSCNGSVPTQVEGPETLFTNAKMKDRAQRLIQDFFDASTSVDGYKDGKAFAELADVDSAVGYFLAMEMTGNYDAAQNSRYAYKDRGRPIAFGPVWDCDLALGSKWATRWKADVRDPRIWIVAKTSFYREWADDPAFCTRLWRAYWAKARAAYQAAIDSIDRLQADLKEPLAANAVKWGDVDGERQADAAAFVKAYMTERLAWLDEQFADVPTLMAALKTSGSKHPYAKDETSLAIGVRRDVQGAYAVVTVANAEIAKVAFFLDGQKLGGLQTVGADRTVRQDLPGDRLGKTEDSCLSLIAYAGDGKTVMTRNYRLVRRPKGGFGIMVR